MVSVRRRAMILFVLCLVLMALGIWMYQNEQERQLRALGDPVDVVIAARDLQPWKALTDKDLTTRRVPMAMTDEGAILDRSAMIGQLPVALIPKGAMVPTYLLRTGPELHPGQRTWELRHDKTVTIDSGVQPDDRVDILAAINRGGQDRVETVLSGARVIAVGRAEKEYTITLAVTIEQGRALMEAENFARQVRVVRDPLNARTGKEERP